jgi:dUTP pyrophosphatase
MSLLKYKLTLPNAIAPTKNHASDAGYDLHLVSLKAPNTSKETKNGVFYYDTGVAIQLPRGMFGMLVARSSIAKHGYMLANNVGIIDNDYRGSIIVALVKTDPSWPDLTLPIKLVQFVPMHQTDLIITKCDDLTETARGDSGGLGSGQFAQAHEFVHHSCPKIIEFPSLK